MSLPTRQIWQLRRWLDPPLPEPKLPAGLRVTRWQGPASRQTHALLELAYRPGGGSVDPYDDWLEWFTTDPEFDAESCFLVWRAETVLGAALCWSSGFVKDLCVSPHVRRRGLGSGLLALAMRHFGERGAPFIELRSHSDNPSGANELYRKMGFVKHET